MKLLKILLFLLFLSCGNVYAVTVTSESFDDLAVVAPLGIWQGDGWFPASGTTVSPIWNGRLYSKYALQGDHSMGTDARPYSYSQISYYNDMTEARMAEGIYFRYWVKYDTNYTFPAEQPLIVSNNMKIAKFAGTAAGTDIEVIWSDTDAANSGDVTKLGIIKYQYISVAAGNIGVYPPAFTDPTKRVSKDIWAKIEIYIQIPAGVGNDCILHVQVNDYDAINETTLPIKRGAYGDTSSFQCGDFTTTPPPKGHGMFWVDDVTIITGEGDLCDSEPTDYNATSTSTSKKNVTMSSGGELIPMQGGTEKTVTLGN